MTKHSRFVARLVLCVGSNPLLLVSPAFQLSYLFMLGESWGSTRRYQLRDPGVHLLLMAFFMITIIVAFGQKAFVLTRAIGRRSYLRAVMTTAIVLLLPLIAEFLAAILLRPDLVVTLILATTTEIERYLRAFPGSHLVEQTEMSATVALSRGRVVAAGAELWLAGLYLTVSEGVATALIRWAPWRPLLKAQGYGMPALVALFIVFITTLALTSLEFPRWTPKSHH